MLPATTMLFFGELSCSRLVGDGIDVFFRFCSATVEILVLMCGVGEVYLHGLLCRFRSCGV